MKSMRVLLCVCVCVWGGLNFYQSKQFQNKKNTVIEVESSRLPEGLGGATQSCDHELA